MQDSNKSPQPALSSESHSSSGVENEVSGTGENNIGPASGEAQELKLRPDLGQALRQEAITKEDGRYLIYYTFDPHTIQEAEQQRENNLDPQTQAR